MNQIESLEKKSRRFLLDTNVFIAAFKRGFTKTTQLLLTLLSDYELIVNSVLLEEYGRWLSKLTERIPSVREHALILYLTILSKATIVEPDKEHIEKCKPYIPEGEDADLYHAATCLKAQAILITNDSDFNEIKKSKIIVVWNISEAIKKLLNSS